MTVRPPCRHPVKYRKCVHKGECCLLCQSIRTYKDGKLGQWVIYRPAEMSAAFHGHHGFFVVRSAISNFTITLDKRVRNFFGR